MIFFFYFIFYVCNHFSAVFKVKSESKMFIILFVNVYSINQWNLKFDWCISSLQPSLALAAYADQALATNG